MPTRLKAHRTMIAKLPEGVELCGPVDGSLVGRDHSILPPTACASAAMEACFYWQPRIDNPSGSLQCAFRGHVVLCDHEAMSHGEAFSRLEAIS